MSNLTIAVDVMGSDLGPAAIIEGALQAVIDCPELDIVLIGDEKIINDELITITNKYPPNTPLRFEILHAPEVIGYDEQPTSAIKQKKNSSLVAGLKYLRAGNAHGFVSAGSTGALLVGVFTFIKRKQGIQRPALCALMPTKKGFTLLLDCGANAEVKPSYLLQFGELGAEYMQSCMGIENPRVGLVNIGTEKEKGTPVLQEAYNLLESSELNFVGNIEGRSIPEGDVDVAVCDGLVGNIVLKFAEGLAKTLLGMIKEELMSSVISKIGALLAKGAFGKMKKRFDYREVGGAPFLGLESLVVKAHGSSDALAIKNAIKQCVNFEKGKLEV
jgi:glycerol-3-phosphate acyltransferase PlsX